MGKISLVWGWIKRRWLLSSILLLVIIIIAFSLRGGGTSLATVKVEKGSVVSEVSVTGTVEPAQSLDLGFVQGGRISKIYVNVGDKVSQGQLLANLDNSDLSAQLAEANANVDIQQAKLDQLIRGTRPESLKVTQSDLAKAQADLDSYYSGVINILNDAYVKSDDAVKNQIDSFFTDDNTNSPQLTFSSSNSQMDINAQWDRVLAGRELSKWQTELGAITSSSSHESLDAALTSAQNHLSVIRNLLNTLVDVLQASVGLSQSDIDTYKASLNIARTNVNTAATNVTNQQQSILSQTALVQTNQDQYNLLLAGSDPQDIAAQQAQLEQVKASALYAQAQYDKTVLRAPFSGTVTRVLPSVGDVVASNDPVISLIGGGKYEIDANISESDIARVQIGKTASITLDAYGPSVVFDATVAKLDLSATIIDSVATYKATLQFNKEDPRILPGMTANIDILSDKKDGVLYIPTRDILQETDGSYLKVMASPTDQNPKLVKIETGLVGSDGNTEIISGVNEGDIVVAE